MADQLPCPICGKKVRFDSADMPFCSDRCRVIDLANWADEKYVISTARHNELEESDVSDIPEGEHR